MDIHLPSQTTAPSATHATSLRGGGGGGEEPRAIGRSKGSAHDAEARVRQGQELLEQTRRRLQAILGERETDGQRGSCGLEDGFDDFMRGEGKETAFDAK